MSILFDDGSSEYLYETIGGPVSSGHPVTMACWAKTDDTGHQSCLMCVSDGDAVDRISLHFASGQLVAQSRTTLTREARTVSGTTANKWHHCAGVWGCR